MSHHVRLVGLSAALLVAASLVVACSRSELPAAPGGEGKGGTPSVPGGGGGGGFGGEGAATGVGGVEQLALGAGHTCALNKAGAVWCWGDNGDGQLGTGDLTSSTTPVETMMTGARGIAAGYRHTCAIGGDGTVRCWGDNDSGQLGDGTLDASSVPVDVVGLSGVVALGLSEFHSCAVTDLGQAFCWGSNSDGQLGNGTFTPSATPVPVVGAPPDLISVSAGNFSTCVLSEGALVSCFGYNASGELGFAGPSSAFPVEVPAVAGAVMVRAGGSHGCAQSPASSTCWGNNNNGQVGNGVLEPTTLPTMVLTGTTSVAPGFVHTCSLGMGGTVFCWGSNFSGALGDGTGVDHSVPEVVPGLAGVTDLVSGTLHVCALRGPDDLRCWGENSFGQIGDGTTAMRETPVSVDL